MTKDFGPLGFYRVAAVSPPLHLGEPLRNAQETLHWARKAAEQEACAAVFPELGLTGYTCEDLFQSQALLTQAREALAWLARETKGLPLAVVVGAPYRTFDGRTYNAAFVLHRGSVCGAVPKTHLPNYGEFYERRWFVPGGDAHYEVNDELLGSFLLTPRQLFQIGRLVFAVEICEDLWAPIPPSCEHALAGANVVLNLSASNELVAKAEYRRDLVKQQSARLNAAYVYVSAGPLESTKDLVYGGDALAAENGVLLVEGGRFQMEGHLLTADLDIERLLHERSRNITLGTSPRKSYPVRGLSGVPALSTLNRRYEKTPFVPADPATVSERAYEILKIQSLGLARRLRAAGAATAVVGLSGGLDSTLAAIVSVEAMKLLGRPATDVIAVSMPGFGTTERTRSSAASLAGQLGLTFLEIPIKQAVSRHFQDIGHDPNVHDVVYENSQARERTQILFDLANKHNGIVVGTGDMSELALGWCTYNADHMASYAVNVSIPKTLVKHLIRWYAEHVADARTGAVLQDILATPISPELLPANEAGEITQATERLIGPYELHDFFLYHHLRNGFRPAKIFALARIAFAGDYTAEEIKRWLKEFMRRYYRQQFKRTCLPPGPKVGTVSLSPRGDLRMPDEVDPQALLAEVEAL